MTQDGAISNEQREFYRIFSQHLREHDGVFTVEDIERLLMEGKKEVPNLIDEEFFKMGEAILNRYRNKNEEAINERIRRLAEEEARKRALAEEERLRREEEERIAEEARLAEEARIQAELDAGEAAKQAYWDEQELPGDEAKVVPDLPASADPLPEEGDRRGGSKLKLLVVVVVGLIAGGAAYAYFIM